MAKSPSFFGLRKGSTKSLTFSVLEGQQITKDRVKDIANPQTNAQMLTRVAFSTVTIAAQKLLPLIGISFEGITSKTRSKRKFIALNAKRLQDFAKNMSAGGSVQAAFSPKGNSQLIPNSYIVSKGSLRLPSILTPKTHLGGSFAGSSFALLTDGTQAAALTIGSTFTGLELWRAIYGIGAGMQVTAPQIYIDGVAKSKGCETVEGEDVLEDLVRYADFGAPRVVLSSADAGSITIAAGTTAAQIAEVMKSVVVSSKSNETLLDNMTENFTVAAGDGVLNVNFGNKTYGDIFGVSSDDVIAAHDVLAALAIIISKQDENGTWRYSESEFVCVWEELDSTEASCPNYFGYTLANAIDSYRTQSSREGNFMQTGTTEDIVPSSFA